jgi:hypothetical protein
MVVITRERGAVMRLLKVALQWYTPEKRVTVDSCLTSRAVKRQTRRR